MAKPRNPMGADWKRPCGTRPQNAKKKRARRKRTWEGTGWLETERQEIQVTQRLCKHLRLLSPRGESHVYRSIFEQNHQLESRMREIRQSGSEGGGGREASPYP